MGDNATAASYLGSILRPDDVVLVKASRGGQLWQLAQALTGLETAPKGFGKFSGDLLVGNFGDGRINVFDLKTGRFEGTVEDRNGQPIVIPGLWGLQRGTKQSGGKDSVWFAAGIEDEEHGLLGTLRAAK